MARHSYERARWNRREARRRMVVDVWPFFVFTYSHLFRSRPECFFDEASVIDFSQSDATLFRLLTPEQQRKVILEGNQKGSAPLYMAAYALTPAATAVSGVGVDMSKSAFTA